MLHTPQCVKVFSKNCKTYYELSLSNGLFKQIKIGLETIKRTTSLIMFYKWKFLHFLSTVVPKMLHCSYCDLSYYYLSQTFFKCICPYMVLEKQI